VEILGAEVRRRARGADGQPFVPEHPDLAARALVLPVGDSAPPTRSARGPQAWVAAVKDAGGLGEVDRLALHQAVTVVALELLRRRVADSTERRLAGDVLAALVAGELAGPELARRLDPFRLGPRVAALAVEPDAEDALAAVLDDASMPALIAAEGGRVYALVPGLPDDELVELGERAGARVAVEAPATAGVGAGRAVDAADARRTIYEARCALEARSLGGGNGNGLATWRDLGSFQLLLALQDHEALGLFCDSLLGPIEAGEGQYGGELMRSLEAFIECNGQWERAAQQLYCHRHTLRYRIRRIEELTGRDLGNARDRIEFWLALRGKEIASR
jgi:purine catabolism regulator